LWIQTQQTWKKNSSIQITDHLPAKNIQYGVKIISGSVHSFPTLQITNYHYANYQLWEFAIFTNRVFL